MRVAPYTRTVKRRKIGAWHASHRYTRPIWFGRYSCRSAKRGTAVGVMWATAWQCGQVTTRFFSWSWCRWLAESMYRDMCGARGGSCCCVCRVEYMLPQRAPACASVGDMHRFTHTGRVMSRVSAPRKGEDAVGKRRVLAAEGLSLADLLACDAGRGQLRADRVALALAVDAQHRHVSERRHFRPGRRTAAVAPHPVGDAYLERGAGVDAQQADARHALTQLRRQAIDHERQHVRAERVTYEQHALLVPGREVVAQQARHVARGRLRRALAPEILQRVQSHGRHATRCQARGELLIEPGPAAIPGEQQREFLRLTAGMHFRHRQVPDVGRGLGRGCRARGEARVGVAKMWRSVALDSAAMTQQWQRHHPRA